jgi:hypothetical protein
VAAERTRGQEIHGIVNYCKLGFLTVQVKYLPDREEEDGSFTEAEVWPRGSTGY